MAVIGSATVTLTQYRDIQSVTRYYKLQIVGSSAPLKPETKPPSSDWTDSEPACDISKELYFCDLTIFSNGEGEYSKVSKSTSYEAAKEAYNKAQSAKDSIDNLEIGGRNLLIGSEKGVVNTNADTSSYADIKLQAHNGSTYVGQEFSFGVTAGEHIEYTYTSKYSGNNIRIGDNGSAHDAANTFLVPEYKEGVVYTFSCDVIDDRPNVVGGYVLKNIKLEKGNKATDWTPAPEDVDAGIANVQTGVDSLNDSVYGVQTFEYILDGVTIPVHKREDGTYYYILNDVEVDVAEADLVHDADGDLVSYQEGGINESLNDISNNIDTIDTKVDGFNAREDAIYKSIQDNSLIARKNARVEENSIIITNDTTTEELLNYLQLDADAITIYGEGDQIVTIAKYGGNSGYMEMAGTSLLIAQESRLSTIRLRSADRIGNLAFVAGSDGHVSLREVLD